VPLFRGKLGPRVKQYGMGRGLPRTKWYLDPCIRLATIHWKIGDAVCPLFLKGGGFPSNTMSHVSRSTSITSGILIHPAVWPQYRHGPKIGGGAVFLLGRVAGSPSNTIWPGPRLLARQVSS